MSSSFFVSVVIMMLLLSTLSLQQQPQSPTNKKTCLMRGTCDMIPSFPLGNLPAPCVNTGGYDGINPLKDLDGETLKKFQTFCPFHHERIVNNSTICCDSSQIKSLVTNIEKAHGILNKCPSCARNFIGFFCGMSCDNNQVDYMSVLESKQSKTVKNGETLVSLKIGISKKFRDDLFDSCSSVTFAGLSALNLVCLREDCNPSLLLEVPNSRDRSPFNVTFDWIDEEEDKQKKVMPVYAIPCYKSPTAKEWPESQISCPCSDCQASCPNPFPFDDGSNQKANSIMVVGYSSLGLFIALLLVTTLFTLVLGLRRRRSNKVYVISLPPITSASSRDSINIIDHRHSPRKVTSTVFCSRSRLLRGWTIICINHPLKVTFIGLIIMVVSSVGLIWIRMESDPVLLWSASDSTARLQKNYFDSNFGPFFRIQQIIITVDQESEGGKDFTDEEGRNWTSLFRKEFLKEVLFLQNNISQLSGRFNDKQVTLHDVCFAPVSPGSCLINSPLNYFQSNELSLDLIKSNNDYLDHLKTCLESSVASDSPLGIPCLSEWGGPVIRDVVFGWRESNQDGPHQEDTDDQETQTTNYRTRPTSAIITLLLKNSLDTEDKKRAESFETVFLNFMKSYTKRSVEVTDIKSPSDVKTLKYKVSYFSESKSLTDEIDRQSHSDITTIAISYSCMFLYIAFCLGNKVSSSFLINSRVTLGFAGVIIVLASVSSAIGFLSWFHFFDFNLIIIEVIPFLVLAVGVDNLFIIVNSFDREMMKNGQQKKTSSELLPSIISVEAGPSILISSASESGCFLIGFFVSKMPAVRVFAVTASLSLIFLLIFQMTIFLPLFALDQKRREKKSTDLFMIPLKWIFTGYRFVLQSKSRSVSIDETSSEDREDKGTKSLELSVFVTSKIISKVVTNKFFKIFIIIFWCLSLTATLSLIPRLNLGLDQQVSVPSDSYVIDYFEDQKNVLRVGPPLYFVIQSESVDLLEWNVIQEVASLVGCSNESLANLVAANSLASTSNASSSSSLISSGGSLFLNEFPSWLTSKACCRLSTPGGEYCSEESETCKYPCLEGANNGDDDDDDDPDEKPPPPPKQPYPLDSNLTRRLLPVFLEAPSDINCPFGGKAAFSYTVNFSGIENQTKIKSSYLSTFHVPVKSSKDMINSLKFARIISEKATKTLERNKLNAKVFPYSIFYVFYEQYLETWSSTLIGLSSSLAAVIVIIGLSRVLIDFKTHFILLFSLISHVIHIMGLMFVSGIELNALSLVNLIMSIGISVEFINHFLVSWIQKMNNNNSENFSLLTITQQTLKTTGASILSGILITKFIGVLVLVFASSQIFSIYYFRFYVILILVGFLHGLIYIPALLSFLEDFLTVKERFGNNFLDNQKQESGEVIQIQGVHKDHH